MMIITNEDRWDKRLFNESLEYNTELQKVEATGSKRVHNFAEFAKDIFCSMFKYEPQARDPDTAPANERWADEIYNEITQLQEWRDLRERTRMNAESSSAAAAEFCNKFMDAVPYGQPNENQERELIPADLDMSAVRRAARTACGKAAEEADKTNEMIQAFAYGVGTGKPQYASPSMKKDVAAKLQNNYHLKRIAELAGRMRRIASEKQKQKTKHGVDELADITVGDDLARLIPAEIAKLSHPMLKRDFQKKYLEKSLLQYKLRGKERKGRGPLVVCIDESGSMSGSRDVWAKAVSLALLQIAQQQNRKYAMIHFDSRVTRIDRFDKKAEFADIMDAVCHFTNGGTNFDEPLSKAQQIIVEEKDFKQADIIFLTDGSCEVDNNWLKIFNQARKDQEFHVISVVISDYSDSCNKFSDKVIHIDDITNDDDALQAMFSI
jgi:uncharacterized protein with von Willebrand factor type A (vWA) domain